MRPELDYGEEVRALRNLRNDGTYPGLAVGRLLIRRGSVGYVRDIGTFLQDQIIYSVHFLEEDRLVGCREEELQRADLPWTPRRFEPRDKVAAKVPLGIRGRVLVEQGEIGEVIKVLDETPGKVSYQVHFIGRDGVQVPEAALDLVPRSDDVYSAYSSVEVEWESSCAPESNEKPARDPSRSA